MNKVKQRSPQFMRFFAWFARPVLRFALNIKVTGLENIPDTGPAILAANHFSWWEPPSMIASILRPIYFIAANDFKWEARIAWIVKLYGSIPVDRVRFEKKTIYLALDKLKEGQLVGIFPQGGMMHNEITEAKAGVMFLGYKADVPIIPIGISGQIDPGLSWKKFRRPEITVRIGKAYRLEMLPETWKEKKHRMLESGDELMAHIAALVEPSLRGKYKDHPIVTQSENFL